MKLDWKKSEKTYYLPGTEPGLVTLPAFGFFAIRGAGDPNEPGFRDHIEALYALSYAVKMSPKSGIAPEGYAEYSVYPLEGVWDASEEAKARGDARLAKREYVFDLMIRQPDFLDAETALAFIERTKAKKRLPLLDQARYEAIEERRCVQLLHLGPYDAEPESFARMEAFCAERGLTRLSKVHREIYLSDARKTESARLKTVLRFRVA